MVRKEVGLNNIFLDKVQTYLFILFIYTILTRIPQIAIQES